MANEDPVALLRSAGGLLLGGLGAVATITGLATASAVVALNTIGVIGLGTAFVAAGAYSINDDKPDHERIRNTLVATAIGAVVLAVIYFAFGRPLDANERQFNVLSFMGIAVLLGSAMLLALAKTLFEPAQKACPDCANSVLAAAKKCQHCGYRFGVTAR